MTDWDLGCQSWVPLPAHFLGRNFLGLGTPLTALIVVSHLSVRAKLKGRMDMTVREFFDWILDLPLPEAIGLGFILLLIVLFLGTEG